MHDILGLKRSRRAVLLIARTVRNLVQIAQTAVAVNAIIQAFRQFSFCSISDRRSLEKQERTRLTGFLLSLFPGTTDMDPLVANSYLEQEVLTASPIRLRWLLINKAVQLTRIVGQLWSEDQYEKSIEWSVWLRDVLNELLAGVHGSDDLARQVSDLYVFMLKLLTEAEFNKDKKMLNELEQLLQIESETWTLLQKQPLTEAAPTPAAAAPAVPAPAALGKPPAALAPTFQMSGDGESSLCIDA